MATLRPNNVEAAPAVDGKAVSRRLQQELMQIMVRGWRQAPRRERRSRAQRHPRVSLRRA